MFHSTILSGFLAVSLSAVPIQAAAESVPGAAEVATRIDVAGRQRMLSQRMAKAACLMAENVDAAAARTQLSGAHQLFSSTDIALRDGDADLGLSRETSKPVLDALAKIDAPWTVYSIILASGMDVGAFGKTELELLDRTGLEVLRNMNAAVNVTARTYGEMVDEIPLGLAITIDIAGRQRMLTQRAVKEVCMIRASADPAVQIARLAETVNLFDISLTALRFGFPNAGIVPPPSAEVTSKLTEVANLWAPVKEALDLAGKGTPLTDAQLEQIARQSELLLRTMNEAVGLYGA